jgi:Cytochrome oxidase assembly protein
MVSLQLVLGALMRPMGAGVAMPDFPLAFGRLVPPLETSAVVVHFLHRLGALAVTLCVGWLMARILRQDRAKKRLLRPAVLLAGLVLLQLTLGALTIWTRRAVLPMTAHVAVGAAVLATSVVIALRAVRLTAAPAAVPGQGFLSGRGINEMDPSLCGAVVIRQSTNPILPVEPLRPAGKSNRARARAHEREGADRRSAFGAKPENIVSL